MSRLLSLFAKLELGLWAVILGVVFSQGACLDPPVAKYGPGPMPVEDCSKIAATIVAFAARAEATTSEVEFTAELDLAADERLGWQAGDSCAGTTPGVECAISRDGGPVASVTLCDDGEGVDETAGDGIYSGVMTTGTEPLATVGIYDAVATALIEKGVVGSADWYSCPREATDEFEIE